VNLIGKVALATVLLLAITIPAPAQIKIDLGHIGPSNAEIVGAAVGLAAVSGVVLYLTLHKTTITGCLKSADGTNLLTLTSEADSLTYQLIDGPRLNPGERVKIQGKKKKDKTGNRSFRVKKLNHDYGPCIT
jgi:hypothetical protein